MLIADACAEPLPMGSLSHVKPVLDKKNIEIHGNLNAKGKASRNVVTEITLGEGNIVKGKTRYSCSPDISQISGPEEKSKPTPHSQTGFRDPASVGGGQQLTLLSIEVALISFLLIHNDCYSCKRYLVCLRLYSSKRDAPSMAPKFLSSNWVI